MGSLMPKKKKPCIVYLKILGCLLFLLVYFAIFLQESINARKLKKQQKRSVARIRRDDMSPVERVAPTGATPNSHNNSVEKLKMYEYSDELNAALEQEFAIRNQLLAEECANLKLVDALPPNAHELFISHGHNLIWCPVFKAASSMWLYFFNLLGGYSVDYLHRSRAPLELARKKFPRPTQEELEEALPTSSSFFIVREPFERLVSGYRNKLEGGRNKFYKELGERIVKRFRKTTNGTTVDKRTKGPTFEEFLRYILETAKTSGVGTINEHWIPIYKFCTPCTINYTLIVKTETLARDSEYILRQALVESLYEKLPRKNHLRFIANRAMTDSKNVKFKYFSKLSDVNILDELLNIYGPDFQLFGFNSNAYYEVLADKRGKRGSTTE